MRRIACVFAAVLAISLAIPVQGQQRSIPVTPLPPGTEMPKPTRIRVGGNVETVKLVSLVQPVYPPIAIQAHISGTVVLHVVIASDGTIKEATAVSGPDLLLQSAIDAVKQWRYQPTLLNGQPVEVDTTVRVVYELSGDAGQEQTPLVQVQGAAVEKASDGTQPIDPQLKADILIMLDKMHIRENQKAAFQTLYQAIRPTILRTLPDTPNKEKIADAYGEKLEDLMTSPGYTNEMIAIYAKYFSDDDIKAVTAFYDTPAGQHFLAATPQVEGDAARLGMRIAANNLMGIFKELCSEYPELQGKAAFCPANDTEKKGQLNQPTGIHLGD